MLRRLNPKQLASLYDDSKERMPLAEREQWLNLRLARQIGFAYRHAPAVKKRFDDAGVSPRHIRSIKDLERLPVTTKDELVILLKAEVVPTVQERLADKLRNNQNLIEKTRKEYDEDMAKRKPKPE